MIKSFTSQYLKKNDKSFTLHNSNLEEPYKKKKKKKKKMSSFLLAFVNVNVLFSKLIANTLTVIKIIIFTNCEEPTCN